MPKVRCTPDLVADVARCDAKMMRVPDIMEELGITRYLYTVCQKHPMYPSFREAADERVRVGVVSEIAADLKNQLKQELMIEIKREVKAEVANATHR